MKLEKLIANTFHKQLVYSRARGGFWMLINWANYFSLFFELGLLFWITIKAFVRAHPEAQSCCQRQITNYAHKSLRKKLSKTFTTSQKELKPFDESIVVIDAASSKNINRRAGENDENGKNGKNGKNSKNSKKKNSNKKQNEIKFNGLPTRLKASVILSIFMTLGK